MNSTLQIRSTSPYLLHSVKAKRHHPAHSYITITMVVVVVVIIIIIISNQ